MDTSRNESRDPAGSARCSSWTSSFPVPLLFPAGRFRGGLPRGRHLDAGHVLEGVAQLVVRDDDLARREFRLFAHDLRDNPEDHFFSRLELADSFETDNPLLFADGDLTPFGPTRRVAGARGWSRVLKRNREIGRLAWFRSS